MSKTKLQLITEIENLQRQTRVLEQLIADNSVQHRHTELLLAQARVSIQSYKDKWLALFTWISSTHNRDVAVQAGRTQVTASESAADS